MPRRRVEHEPFSGHVRGRLAASCRKQDGPNRWGDEKKNNGAEGARTPNPCLAKAVLSQLSYGPICEPREASPKLDHIIAIQPQNHHFSPHLGIWANTPPPHASVLR